MNEEQQSAYDAWKKGEEERLKAIKRKNDDWKARRDAELARRPAAKKIETGETALTRGRPSAAATENTMKSEGMDTRPPELVVIGKRTDYKPIA